MRYGLRVPGVTSSGLQATVESAIIRDSQFNHLDQIDWIDQKNQRNQGNEAARLSDTYRRYCQNSNEKSGARLNLS